MKLHNGMIPLFHKVDFEVLALQLISSSTNSIAKHDFN